MINIVHSVSVMNRAGQETFLMNILRNIDRERFKFIFLCSLPNVGDYDGEIKSLGGIISHLPINWLQKVKYLNYLGDIYAYYLYFKRNKQYQIFHIHNYHSFTTFLSVLGAKLAGVHTIIVHSHNSNAPHPLLHKLFRPILNLFKIERYACSQLASDWMFGKNKNVHIVKNGVNLKKFKFSKLERETLRSRLGISENEFLIGHIGRFNYQKNHTFLIDIFLEIHKICPEAKLLLLGDGELKNDIEDKVYVFNLEQSVLFEGIKSNISEYLSAMDLFLFPSLFEGLPVVLVEAQANGLTSVISNEISKEVVLSNNIYMESLERSPKEWANIVLSHKNDGHEIDVKNIKKNGYDIQNTVSILMEMYSIYNLK